MPQALQRTAVSFRIAASSFHRYNGSVTIPKSLPYTRSCFVCGAENPVGLKMRFFRDPHTKTGVRATFRFAEHHVGFRGVIHGGILATVLDEAMAWAGAVATRRFGIGAELNVRFLKSVAAGQDLIVTAELAVDHKRLRECRGEIRDAKGTVYAKGTAKFVPLADAQLQAFHSDLRWDETTVRPEEVLEFVR